MNLQERLEFTGRQLVGASAWATISLKYRESTRHYHTISHIEKLFELFESHASSIQNKTAFLLALIFHDVVYFSDAKARPVDNESASVSFMRNTLNEFEEERHPGIDDRALDIAAEIILATRAHTVESSFLKSNPDTLRDAELFLDCDCEVLSACPERIQVFEKQVRAEYRQFSFDEYAAGRTKALRNFGCREKIYFSAEFLHKEQDAKRNIQSMIQFWQTTSTDLL